MDIQVSTYATHKVGWTQFVYVKHGDFGSNKCLEDLRCHGYSDKHMVKVAFECILGF